MTILRRRPPYTCRNPKGAKPCAAVLTEADGKLCQPCEEAVTRAREKFFDKPIRPPEKVEERKPRGKFWPSATKEETDAYEAKERK